MIQMNRPVRFPRRTFSGIAPQAVLAGVLLVSCSCQSVNQFVQRTVPGAPDSKGPAASRAVEHAYVEDMSLADTHISRLQHTHESGQQAAPAEETGRASPAGTDTSEILGSVNGRSLQGSSGSSSPQSAPQPAAFPSVPSFPPVTEREMPRAQTGIDAGSGIRQVSAESTDSAGLKADPNVPEHVVPADALPRSINTDAVRPPVVERNATKPVKHPPESRLPMEPRPAGAMRSAPSQERPSAVPGPHSASPNIVPFPVPEYAGDEYIHDGGDRHLPVHYNGHLRMGLDTEDTVAEWVDDEGKQHVRASNRVSVYAPRFAAVRSATLTEQGVAIDRATGHHDDYTIAGLETKLVLDEQVQADEVKGMLMRSRPSGLEGQAADGGLHQVVKASRHHKLINLSEEFQFIRDGQFNRVDRAVIGEAIEAALEWSDDQQPVIVAHDQAGQEVEGRVYAQDMTGIEDRRTPGELTIVKLADRKVAHPGDVITFTIRFENTGGRELRGVRVVDNLSPRLAYVEGSVDSDRNGSLNVEENGAGGELLTFEFEAPLPGQSDGWVTFQCRVR